MSYLEYENCILCPRQCNANRSQGDAGFCGMSADMVAARAALHRWEEPCLSGDDDKRGAGTVFFSGCNLGCIFCQNKPISTGDINIMSKAGNIYDKVVGKVISTDRLVDIFFELEQKGAYNIDLVTPTHFVPAIRDAINIAKSKNISIPFVYNSGGYEKADIIKTLDGLIDIYLPDFKYFDDTLASKYSNASNYFKYAASALEEMVRQCPAPSFDDAGIMQKGVIVRHLVLPDNTDDSKKVIQYLYETFGDKIFISILNQYTPVNFSDDFPELNRKLSPEEYDLVVDYAIDIGVENGFIQEGDTASESFIPIFQCEGI